MEGPRWFQYGDAQKQIVCLNKRFSVAATFGLGEGNIELGPAGGPFLSGYMDKEGRTLADGLDILLQMKEPIEVKFTPAEAGRVKGPGSHPNSPAGQHKGHSDKGSGGKHVPSSSIQFNPSTSCALGAKHVTVPDKFPLLQRTYNTTGAYDLGSLAFPSPAEAPLELSQGKLSEEVLQFCMKRMFTPIMRYAPPILFSGEASLVQLMRMVMQEVCMLCDVMDELRCAEPLSSSAALEEAVEMDSHGSRPQYKLGAGPWCLGMEQWMHVQGALKGRIELQFLRKVEGGTLFKGALEVGVGLHGAALSEKVDQAEKECICMWLHNAARQHFAPVFVLLFDGAHICRIEFSGLYTPMQPSLPTYQQGMPCSELRGVFRSTVGVQLWDSLPACKATATSMAGAALLLGAMMVPGDDNIHLAELEARVQAADNAVASKVADFVATADRLESAMPEPDRKRPRRC